MILQSCGSSKQVTNANYYDNPHAAQEEQRLETLNVDILVEEETDKLRVVGIGEDIDEADARMEAIRAGQREIASLLETTVIEFTRRHLQDYVKGNKKYKGSQTNGVVEYSVAQVISVRAVGTPDRYRLEDGSYKIYRCIELKTPTTEVLGKVYDDLTREEIIGMDYDRDKFINENMELLQELRAKTK